MARNGMVLIFECSGMIVVEQLGTIFIYKVPWQEIKNKGKGQTEKEKKAKRTMRETNIDMIK